MRRHPVMIHWALGLKIKCHALPLLSEITLGDFAHYHPINSGIVVDALLESCQKHEAGLDVDRIDAYKIKFYCS